MSLNIYQHYLSVCDLQYCCNNKIKTDYQVKSQIL